MRKRPRLRAKTPPLERTPGLETEPATTTGPPATVADIARFWDGALRRLRAAVEAAEGRVEGDKPGDGERH